MASECAVLPWLMTTTPVAAAARRTAATSLLAFGVDDPEAHPERRVVACEGGDVSYRKEDAFKLTAAVVHGSAMG